MHNYQLFQDTGNFITEHYVAQPRIREDFTTLMFLLRQEPVISVRVILARIREYLNAQA
jgi:hypothetical protein